MSQVALSAIELPHDSTAQTRPTTAPKSKFSRDMLVGTACWSAFAVIAIALQGVVLDEATVPGQIIAGVVNYPGGHPHDIFYKTAYSFPNVAAAGFLSLWNNEVALSAVRNWLFLSLSLVTPFAATVALTRRASWGHIAAALTLFGGHLLYGGLYPIRVFPHFYSHGHVGLQLAVLAGSLIVGRMWLTGAALAGMMPAMHAAMTLTIWPWLAAYVFCLWRVGDKPSARRLLAGWGIGVAFSVVVAALIQLASHPFAAVTPYTTLPGAQAAWAGFEVVSDDHRKLPTLMTRAYLLSPVAFVALSYVFIWATSMRERRWTGGVLDGAAIAALGLFSMAIVYGVWLLHLVLGTLPGTISMPMPYRLSNVAATLLIPVSVAATAAILRLMKEHDEWLARTMTAILVAGFAVAMCGLVRPALSVTVERQMLFVLWGLPFGFGLWLFRSAPRQRWHLLLPACVTLLVTAAFWSTTKGAVLLAAAIVACAAAAALAQRFLARVDVSALRQANAIATAVAVVVCAVSVLSARGLDVAPNDRTWKMSEDDVTIRKWLSEHAADGEPVLEPIFPRLELQAKARRPVLFEAETLWLMTYMPSLAPRIGTMARELYGVDYERAGDFARHCPNGRVTWWCDVWNDAWRTRPRAEWIDLAHKYRFRLVMAPPNVDIDLPLALETKIGKLYEVPLAVGRQNN